MAAPSLLIRAPKRPRELVLQDMLEEARGHMDALVEKNAASLTFERVYSTQYNLVVGGKGQALYEIIVGVLSRLSLVTRPTAYWIAANLVRDCAMYLDHVWLKRWRKPLILDVAQELYDRPVAYHWRRALAYAKWTVRLKEWRAAFDVFDAAPGRSGAVRAARHFHACAAQQACAS